MDESKSLKRPHITDSDSDTNKQKQQQQRPRALKKMPLQLRLSKQLILYDASPGLHHDLFMLSSLTANYVQPRQY